MGEAQRTPAAEPIHRRLVMKRADKLRLGRGRDGGYVVPYEIADVDGLLSFGVGPDLSFENAFVDLTRKPCFAFDHTISRSPAHRAGVVVERLGIGPVRAGKLDTLDGFLARHPFATCAVKMDVEGAEWDVLAACSEEAFARIRVLVLELHGLLVPGPVKAAVLDRLLRHYEPVHLHANNFGRVLRVAGHDYPSLVEASFLHRDALPEAVVDLRTIPTPDDRPNHPRRPDVVLDWWIDGRP